MTDNTDTTYGGNRIPECLEIRCILNEGAITVTTSATVWDDMGTYGNSYVFASQLAEGQLVALSNDTGNTWALTYGNIVVERAVTAESLVIGRIKPGTMEGLIVNPATSAACDDLSERLAGKYYRTAVIQIFVAPMALKAEVYHDGSNAVAIGVTNDLSLNITSEYLTTRTQQDRTTETKLMATDSGGAGFIPCHYVASGSSGDLSNCLVLPYTLAAAHTGA